MTSEILSAMKTVLDNHTWTTETPALVTKGPIAAGNLLYPAVGVMATSGVEAGRGRGYADTVEGYTWTLANFLGLKSIEEEYLALIAWRDEARVLARTAVDSHWGEGNVHMTNVTGWETEFYEVPGPSGIRHLAEITIKMEVQYREQA